MSTPGNTSDTPKQNNQEIDYEKRFKDTQADHTRISQERARLAKEKAELEAELEVLRAAKPKLNIDAKTQEELDSLKFSDPDAWRDKLSALEAEANNEYSTKVNEAKKTKSLQVELGERASILEEFQAAHQDVAFTDELLQFDIPLRITKKLEEGKVTYREFLQEAYDFVKAPKVIGDGNKTLGQPNITNSGGDDTPTKQTSKVDNIYENLEF